MQEDHPVGEQPAVPSEPVIPGTPDTNQTPPPADSNAGLNQPDKPSSFIDKYVLGPIGLGPKDHFVGSIPTADAPLTPAATPDASQAPIAEPSIAAGNISAKQDMIAQWEGNPGEDSHPAEVPTPVPSSTPSNSSYTPEWAHDDMHQSASDITSAVTPIETAPATPTTPDDLITKPIEDAATQISGFTPMQSHEVTPTTPDEPPVTTPVAPVAPTVGMPSEGAPNAFDVQTAQSTGPGITFDNSIAATPEPVADAKPAAEPGTPPPPSSNPIDVKFS